MMAEVTYYFNSRTISWWTDPGNMVDGNIETFASITQTGDYAILDGNTCPGTDLGTISKVELRVHGYGDGDDRIDLRAYFGGVNQGDEHQLTMPASAGWSAYAEITNDTNSPTPWDWSDVVALDLGDTPSYGVKFNKVGKGNTMYCAKVEIRVTYTPSGGAYYHGLKVQGVGELALCDVGSHPLRIRKVSMAACPILLLPSTKG